ncbi:hypothetical protein HG15A2_14080 [Adhaeretor mobilis]|uniref:Uncharacterized protein n=2 Tax=Adhaeretor mobilis TaxID=1930276 RepID=A0A517MTC7_9BACT|nr:hypothetical protein HG15A2_14080 [Adhaeretor mobilis]
MSLDQVMAAVNQNSVKLRSLQTNNAKISVPGMLGIPSLSGNIAAERPGRIRLQASTALTGAEVDLGSNDELFWLWVRRNEPPAVYYSRHDQFAGSAAQRMMPIQPEWLLDALGFVEFKPSDFHEGPTPHGKGTVEIRSVVNSPMGQLTKNTVVNSTTAQVLEQHVYTSEGALLASTVAESHRYYPEVGVSLPQRISVQMPAAQLSLTIDMGTVVLNQVAASPQLWAMPQPQGVPLMDLGRAAGGLAPATVGGQLSGADWYGPTPAATVASLPSSISPAPAQSLTPVQEPTIQVQQLGQPTQPVQRLPAGGVTRH